MLQLYAPEGWLPEAEDIPSESFGAWCTLTLESSEIFRNKDQNRVMGELIAVDDTSIFILNDISLNQIPQRAIVKSEIELDRKHYEYGTHTCLGIVSTISHGLVSIITAPIWILFGWPIASR